MTSEVLLALALVVAGFSAGFNFRPVVSPPELPVIYARVSEFEKQIDHLEQALRASCPSFRGPNDQTPEAPTPAS